MESGETNDALVPVRDVLVATLGDLVLNEVEAVRERVGEARRLAELRAAVRVCHVAERAAEHPVGPHAVLGRLGRRDRVLVDAHAVRLEALLSRLGRRRRRRARARAERVERCGGGDAARVERDRRGRARGLPPREGRAGNRE